MPDERKTDEQRLADGFVTRARQAITNRWQDVRAEYRRLTGQQPEPWDVPVVWRNDDGTREVMTHAAAFDRERAFEVAPDIARESDEHAGREIRTQADAILKSARQGHRYWSPEDVQAAESEQLAAEIPEHLVWLWEEAKEEGWLEPFTTKQELIAQLETLESADRVYREREAHEQMMNPTAGMAPDEVWKYEQEQRNADEQIEKRTQRFSNGQPIPEGMSAGDRRDYEEAVSENRLDLMEEADREHRRQEYGCREDCFVGWDNDPVEAARAAAAHDAHMTRSLELEERLDRQMAEFSLQEGETESNEQHLHATVLTETNDGARSPATTAVAESHDRYTVLRHGQFYTTDKHTIEALRLIREWPNSAEEFFQSRLAEGRIVPGPVRAQGQTVGHVIADVAPAQPGQGQYVAATRARTNSNGEGF